MAAYNKACEIHDRDMSNLGLVIELGQELNIWST